MKITNWLHHKVVTEKLNNFLGVILLSILVVFSALYFVTADLRESTLLIVGLAGIPIVILMVTNHTVGWYLLILISVFTPGINRILVGTYIPYGSIVDASLILMFALIIWNAFLQPGLSKKILKDLQHPVSILLFFWVLYWLIQVMNPSGNFGGWFYGIRSVIRMFLIYFLALRVFEDFKAINLFTHLYIILGVTVAFYGIYQEFFGMPSYDARWANATDERINLLYVGGKWRKFSFLTDPAVFGLFMALISIIASLLCLGPCSQRRRFFYLGSSLLCIMGMLFSGTRTAYVIVPIAFVLYVIMNITNVKILALAIFAVLSFLVLLYGPFYSRTLVRFRSAFNPTEDASMRLRDMNRARIQPYIYSHPLGGGLSTTGSQGEKYAPYHPLAGFPPDSGFVKTLLELGWIGLIIELTLYGAVLINGITFLYRCESALIRSYYITYLCAFFALTIAYYAKKSVDQFPINYFLYGAIAVLINLNKMISNPGVESDE